MKYSTIDPSACPSSPREHNIILRRLTRIYAASGREARGVTGDRIVHFFRTKVISARHVRTLHYSRSAGTERTRGDRKPILERPVDEISNCSQRHIVRTRGGKNSRLSPPRSPVPPAFLPCTADGGMTVAGNGMSRAEGVNWEFIRPGAIISSRASRFRSGDDFTISI